MSTFKRFSAFLYCSEMSLYCCIVQVMSQKRAANISEADKVLIVELVAKYHTILENKETDKVTVSQKQVAWEAVTTEFNASSIVRRTVGQIKQV